jgi:hypothetical protein
MKIQLLQVVILYILTCSTQMFLENRFQRKQSYFKVILLQRMEQVTCKLPTRMDAQPRGTGGKNSLNIKHTNDRKRFYWK